MNVCRWLSCNTSCTSHCNEHEQQDVSDYFGKQTRSEELCRHWSNKSLVAAHLAVFLLQELGFIPVNQFLYPQLELLQSTHHTMVLHMSD